MRCMKLSKKYGGLQFFAGGETWEITAYTFTADLSKTTINFTSAGQEFTALSSSHGSTYIVYYTATSSVEVCDDATWSDDAYRTVTFATAPTGELLAWLQQNATRLTNKVVETSLRFGADALDKSYLGADSLDRIYLGTDLLYQTLNEYTVTETLSNVTTIGTHPVKILEGKSLTLKYTADANYELLDSVTVANATSNWTKSTGTLVVSNPTGDVTITITAVRITYSITENLTNVTKTGTHPSVIAAGQTLVLNYAAATGYNLPDTVTVTGATSDWKQATGVLTITNPTGAVTITIAGVQPKLATPTNLSVSGDTLTFDSVENAEQYEVFAGGTSIGTYEPVYTLEATTYRWANNPNMANAPLGQYSISYSSNSENFTSLYLGLYTSGQRIIGYNGYPSESYLMKGYVVGHGWGSHGCNEDGEYTTTTANTAYKTITFTTPQTVSKEFYEWAITGGNLRKETQSSGGNNP